MKNEDGRFIFSYEEWKKRVKPHLYYQQHSRQWYCARPASGYVVAGSTPFIAYGNLLKAEMELC